MPLYQIFFRKASSTPPILAFINKCLLVFTRFFYQSPLCAGTQIGEGLYLGHPFGININPGAKIGRNCNIHKGVTIGQQNRGPRKGYPTIGNEVWIGVNAVVVGAITIGDDVLIAPLTFVNRDVPSHSIVFGNPMQIVHRDNATEGYINNKV